LILSLLLLNFEVDIDFVFFWDINISKIEFFKIEVMSPEMALLALKNDLIVLIIRELISKLDHVNSSSDDATLVYRVTILSTWEKVSILLSNISIKTIFESA
jgi:hypothetical protein